MHRGISTRWHDRQERHGALGGSRAARGFTIIFEYIDIGQSGAKDSRPELNELMAGARQRKFDSILVWRFDRFARAETELASEISSFA
jgi:DNA invertase Pin-like site-specific DNA recombinase